MTEIAIHNGYAKIYGAYAMCKVNQNFIQILHLLARRQNGGVAL